MFIDFRERRRERKRNTDVRDKLTGLPPICTPNWDRTHNLSMYPDQGSNLQPFGAQDDTPTK